MKWFYVILIFEIAYFTHGEEESKERRTSIVGPKSLDKNTVNSYSDLLPVQFTRNFTSKEISATKGYISPRPSFVTLYNLVLGDIHMYIFPPNLCSAVWICFARNINDTANGITNIVLEEHCQESLRFHTLEQVVYITRDEKFEVHPYYSPLVEMVSLQTSSAKQVYGFKPYRDFNLEDFRNVRRENEIKFSLAGARILVLTSSPYCSVTVQQPFKGLLEGISVNFSPLNKDEFLKTGSHKDDPSSHYFLAGTKGLEARNKLYEKQKLEMFDPPSKRKILSKAAFDCCPPTWEFEGSVFSTEWKSSPIITYQSYRLSRVQKSHCKNIDKTSTKLQSILIETGEQCEWLRLCFDNTDDFCATDANALSLLFAYDLYIPTDSDQARQFGVTFDQLTTIRINFLNTAKGIEVAYAFSSALVPGITDLMYLESYDGNDPTKLLINVVKSPYCEARLLNDLSAVNIREGTESTMQCLSLSSCSCKE